MDDSTEPSVTPFGDQYSDWDEWFGDVAGGSPWVEFPALYRGSDRERGFLSKSDRAFLLETQTLDLSDKTQRNARTRIRNRILSAYFDAQFLQFLSPRDRQLIFKNARESDTTLNFREGFKEFVRFTYQGLLEDEHDIEIVDILEQAIKEAEEQHTLAEGEHVSVDVDVDIQRQSRVDVEMLERTYTNRGSLTVDDLDVLVNSTHINSTEGIVDAAEIDLADAIYYAARQPSKSAPSQKYEPRDRGEANEIVQWLREFFVEHDITTRSELKEATARFKEYNPELCEDLKEHLDKLPTVAPHFATQLADESGLSDEDASLLNDIIYNPDNIDVEEALVQEARPRTAGSEWSPAEDESLQKFIARVEVAAESGAAFTGAGSDTRKRWEELRSIAEFDEQEWQEYMENIRIDRCYSHLLSVVRNEENGQMAVENADSWDEFVDRFEGPEQAVTQLELYFNQHVVRAAWEKLSQDNGPAEVA